MRRALCLIACVASTLGCIDLDDAPTACASDPSRCSDATSGDSGLDSAIADGDATGTDTPDAGVDANVDAADSSDTSADAACDGACVPGTTESVTGTCTGVFEKKQRTCGSDCSWGAAECRMPSGWQTMKTSPLAGRCNHAMVWTGSKLLVWGGTSKTESGTHFNDGAAYDITTDTWTMMSAPPSGFGPRINFSFAFGGGRLVIFGGIETTALSDGIGYDPSDDTWHVLSSASLAAREVPVMLFASTTGDILVWGGTNGTTTYGDGSAFSPTFGSWTAMPSSPLSARQGSLAVWTGSQAILFSGRESTGGLTADGARYNPVARTWALLEAPPLGWTLAAGAAVGSVGGAMMMFGGLDFGAGTFVNTGLVYDATGHPTIVPTPATTILPSSSRYGSTMWCSENVGKCWVWGGIAGAAGFTSGTLMSDGATLAYPSLSWSAMDSTGAPAARMSAPSSWTGKSAFVWGGATSLDTSSSNCTNTGGIFTP